MKTDAIVAIIYPFWWLGCRIVATFDNGEQPDPRWAWARKLLFGEYAIDYQEDHNNEHDTYIN